MDKPRRVVVVLEVAGARQTIVEVVTAADLAAYAAACPPVAGFAPDPIDCVLRRVWRRHHTVVHGMPVPKVYPVPTVVALYYAVDDGLYDL